MSRDRRIAAAALVGLAAALCPATAVAAYAPRLEARVDPPTPNTSAALTTTLRQEPGESANRTQVIRFPRELRFNPSFAVAGCRREEEDAGACPESSRIGTASAETELGPFSGPVYLTDDFRTVIFLRGFGGVVESKIVGVIRVAADGSFETVLDDLPAVRSTFAQVRLEAGPRSLILTPARCGTYPVSGRFTSHNDETAASETAIEITGCDTEPRISSVTARSRAGRIDLAWTLTAAGARTLITLDRRVASRPWDRWRRVATARAGARRGRNALRLRGAGGRSLRSGVYRLTLTTLSAQGRLSDFQTTQVRVHIRR